MLRVSINMIILRKCFRLKFIYIFFVIDIFFGMIFLMYMRKIRGFRNDSDVICFLKLFFLSFIKCKL